MSHGHRAGSKFSLTYNTWRCMVRRCTDTKHPMHVHYRKLGESVCPRWRRFANFLEDMGERPSRRHTLDRKRRRIGYRPDNCRWATPRQQAHNRDDFGGRVLERPSDGVAMNASRWALRLGITKHSLSSRILRGWDLERALTQKGRKS